MRRRGPRLSRLQLDSFRESNVLSLRSRTLTKRFADASLLSTPAVEEAGQAPGRRLRLLSYNIQVGIRTESFRQYLTRGWRHVLPDDERLKNLDQIAGVLAGYDVVALQEADGGSLRSGFVNQVEYLASRGGFPYWFSQRNRDLGVLGQHGNGVLARFQPQGLEDHRLPGLIPGRGALLMRYDIPGADEPLVIVMLHLSLGVGARELQLRYVGELIAPFRHVIVMGDMNSHLEGLLQSSPLRLSRLTSPLVEDYLGHVTYPSWRPSVGLDHILVSPEIGVRRYEVLNVQMSDHRPVAIEVDLGTVTH